MGEDENTRITTPSDKSLIVSQPDDIRKSISSRVYGLALVDFKQQDVVFVESSLIPFQNHELGFPTYWIFRPEASCLDEKVVGSGYGFRGDFMSNVLFQI